MTQIRLLGDRLHLRHIRPSLVSPAGIHLPQRYQDDRTQYHVLGVGPKVTEEIKPGCYVLIPMLQDSVTLPDETIVARAGQVHAVWENSSK